MNYYKISRESRIYIYLQEFTSNTKMADVFMKTYPALAEVLTGCKKMFKKIFHFVGIFAKQSSKTKKG